MFTGPESFEKKDLPFHAKRLSPSIGGDPWVDLSKPLGSELKELIYEALLVYKVIFSGTKISLQRNI